MSCPSFFNVTFTSPRCTDSSKGELSLLFTLKAVPNTSIRVSSVSITNGRLRLPATSNKAFPCKLTSRRSEEKCSGNFNEVFPARSDGWAGSDRYPARTCSGRWHRQADKEGRRQQRLLLFSMQGFWMAKPVCPKANLLHPGVGTTYSRPGLFFFYFFLFQSYFM